MKNPQNILEEANWVSLYTSFAEPNDFNSPMDLVERSDPGLLRFHSTTPVHDRHVAKSGHGR